MPLQVPPAVAAVNVTAAAFEQNGPTGVLVASGGLATGILSVFVSVQLPIVTE